MFFKRSASINNWTTSSKRKSFGKYSYRQLGVSRRCMTSKFFIETWKVQTSSCIKTTQRSWATWMFLKSLRKDCYTPRPVLLTMRAQKSGRISPMTANLISGPLAASSMKCAPWYRPFALMIWMDCSKGCWRVLTHPYRAIILWICGPLLKVCFRSTLPPDLILNRY
jgi:hypothetical protein